MRWKTRHAKTDEPARWSLPAANRSDAQRSYLALIAIATVVVWQFPFGQTLLYPFTILATWFHEMGHGLASMLLGARFERLVIFPDGSGFALSSWAGDAPGLFHALTAAAGLLGPAVAGAGLIVASRSRGLTKAGLWLLGGALLVSTLVWVRSVAGWVVLPPMGLLAIAIAARGSDRARRLTIEFLGVQAMIGVWRDLGYLFSDGGFVGGRFQASDTQAIADVLVLPYWFWGAGITILIAVILWRALRFASPRTR
jgi:hypothetical protein